MKDIDLETRGQLKNRPRRMSRFSARKQEAQRRRRRKKKILRALILGGIALVLLLILVLGVWGIKKLFGKSGGDSAPPAAWETPVSQEKEPGSLPAETEDSGQAEEEPTADFSMPARAEPLPKDYEAGFAFSGLNEAGSPDEEQVTSTNGILVDLSNNTVVMQREAAARISPASMTKILTILVAAERIQNPDETVVITREVTDYAFSHGGSIVGYKADDEVPVRDLFYGTILPSGADAAVALAVHTAGSEETFVGWMNDKVRELGLSETTHVTNCVGFYDAEHYSTAYDMAVILKAAIENDWCRQVLGTRIYTTAPTQEKPEGIEISNWFLRRIEDKDCGGTVQCAKTGFVNESGNCAASYGVSGKGRPYICVTVNAHSSWRCIYDHVAMYKLYAK